MILGDFVSSYLQDIISHPNFTSCSVSLQQQISHLSFIVNLICNNLEDAEAIFKEHTVLKVSTYVQDGTELIILSWISRGKQFTKQHPLESRQDGPPSYFLLPPLNTTSGSFLYFNL